VAETGVLTFEDLEEIPGVPEMERLMEGPVAVMECAQEIPCNPCETHCPQGAVHLNGDLTHIPIVDGDDCSGCGICIADCPGQAVFVLDMTFAPDRATVAFPYEFLPLPEKGQMVMGTDREGKPVVEARVERVLVRPKNENTAIVTVSVPRDYAATVRSIDWRNLINRRGES
jgi:Fe-S-cluster-containing hydrogenase component 2